MEDDAERKFFYKFLKNIFNENLHELYKDIYYMCRLIGFSAEYVEKMTPAERKLYWVYFKEEMKEKSKDKPTSNFDNNITR